MDHEASALAKVQANIKAFKDKEDDLFMVIGETKEGSDVEVKSDFDLAYDKVKANIERLKTFPVLDLGTNGCGGCLVDGTAGADRVPYRTLELFTLLDGLSNDEKRSLLDGSISEDLYGLADEAIDAVNEALEPGFLLEMRDGDLILVSKAEEFAAELQAVEMTTKELGRMNWPDGKGDAHGFKLTLGCEKRRATFDWFQGLLVKDKPTKEDIVVCVMMDQFGIENARGFEDWCGEIGYDPSEKKAKKVCKAVQDNSKKLEYILGRERYVKMWDMYMDSGFEASDLKRLRQQA
jgi:hypothetical protein